ncbi:MAG: dTDP-4-dehydrorhamnose 3,5-epimerase [Flavobacteriales bacterium]|jgi:dTDP-4-dehydrorhamnose 3,5-epimerase|nr:dTDP-4-dehydrorhamnose 3,5-epimerase [Flavobacteriales bacterium]
MKIEKTSIDGVIILTPNVFGDDRGYFFESFNQQQFEKAIGRQVQFVQDNQSKSQKGVLRGLHFQNPPYAQGKLVRVLAGSVLDVAVDIRKDSPTYGQHLTFHLDSLANKMVWLPEGIAHGFVALEDDTVFFYKCTNYYNKGSEGCILWNDSDLNINWNTAEPILSDKDKVGQPFQTFKSNF